MGGYVIATQELGSNLFSPAASAPCGRRQTNLPVAGWYSRGPFVRNGQQARPACGKRSWCQRIGAHLAGHEKHGRRPGRMKMGREKRGHAALPWGGKRETASNPASQSGPDTVGCKRCPSRNCMECASSGWADTWRVHNCASPWGLSAAAPISRKRAENASRSGKLRPRELRSKAILLTLTERWDMKRNEVKVTSLAAMLADHPRRAGPTELSTTCYDARQVPRFQYIP